MAGCEYERILAGPEEEDRRGEAAGHAHLGGRPHLRRGRLDRQALRRRGPRGPLAGPEETTRFQAEDGRGRGKAPGGGPPRAPDGHAAPEARVPRARGRGWGERIHDLARAQAAGMEPKKDRWERASATSSCVDEMGTNVSLSPLYAWSPKGERAYGSAPRNWGKNVTLLSSITEEGVGPCLAVEGSTTREVFEGRGCGLLYLPPYSPDFNPIEQAFSKVKGLLRKTQARTREALIEAMGR